MEISKRENKRRQREREIFVQRVSHDFKLDFPFQEPLLLSIRRVNRRDIMNSSQAILCAACFGNLPTRRSASAQLPHKDVISCGTENL